MNRRLIMLAALFAISAAALIVRVAYIQLVDDAHYKAEAKDEHFGQQVVRASRGAILDRNGYPLATTIDAYDVFINRPDWHNDEPALTAAAAIAPVIGRQAGRLDHGGPQRGHRPLPGVQRIAL